MDPNLTRRGLLLGGMAALIAGCRFRGEAEPAAWDDAQPRRDGSPKNLVATGLWYEVVAGDTLAIVSRRGGVPVDRIMAANHLATADLKPGMRLWLPGATSIVIEATPPRQGQRPGNDEEPEMPAGDGRYVLVPRSAWATQPVKSNAQAMGRILKLTVHHTDEHPGTAGLPDIEVIKRIDRYHREEKHWCAIGYHFLVGKDGRVYEGRPLKYQGAHVLSNNENNLGISVIGDFTNRLPSERQLVALSAFIDEARKRYKLPVKSVYGHRDLHSSECPGDALYAWLQRYKRKPA